MSYQEQSSLTSGHHHQISTCPQASAWNVQTDRRATQIWTSLDHAQLVQDQSMEQNIDINR